MRARDRFIDRREAGQELARALQHRALADPVVLAMPRGGVPVALEIALALKAPLDLVLVRKIGVPIQPELAAAAVVDGGRPEIVVNEDIARRAGMSRDDIEARAKDELVEIERRRSLYLGGRAKETLDGRDLILVDDGIATGASIHAAIKALQRRKPNRLIIAVPVAPADTVKALREEVDEVICLSTPEPFHAIGMHYRDFHQVPDGEVITLIKAADAARAKSVAGVQSERD